MTPYQEPPFEHRIHTVFVWGVLLKAFDGVVEIIAGLVFYFGSGPILGFLNTLVQNELLEDPQSFVALYLQHILPTLSANASFFALMYLVSHGIVKVFLVIGLLREKAWAYPASIGIFSLFIVYQIYAYVQHHSLFLLVLTILDLFVIALTWHEYRYFKKHHSFPE